jgi:hypothetical protein
VQQPAAARHGDSRLSAAAFSYGDGGAAASSVVHVSPPFEFNSGLEAKAEAGQWRSGILVRDDRMGFPCERGDPDWPKSQGSCSSNSETLIIGISINRGDRWRVSR